jgi:hypothetical protein
MGFVERALLPGERIVLRARLSAIPLLSAAINIAISIVICVMSGAQPIGLTIGVVWFLVALTSFINVAFVLMTTTIVVTNQRLLGKTGFLSRSSVELLLTKLESLEVNQSLLGRMGSYGNIRIHGTGSGKVVFLYIKAPLDVRRACAGSADVAQKLGTGPVLAASPPVPPTGAAPVFEVSIVDRKNGNERWVDVRAANMDQAREFAAATGAVVGEARLKSIS